MWELLTAIKSKLKILSFLSLRNKATFTAIYVLYVLVCAAEET
jgi:hypothetical protein